MRVYVIKSRIRGYFAEAPICGKSRFALRGARGFARLSLASNKGVELNPDRSSKRVDPDDNPIRERKGGSRGSALEDHFMLGNSPLFIIIIIIIIKIPHPSLLQIVFAFPRQTSMPRIFSYNVLSSHLSSPTHFTTLDPAHLSPPARWSKVMKKVTTECENKSILCLQELSRPWAGPLQTFLSSADYEVKTQSYMLHKFLN